MTDGIYFNSHSDLRQFGIRLQEKDQQLQQERAAREQAERERNSFRRDFEIAESRKLCNAYELARMKMAVNAIASELDRPSGSETSCGRR
jgi:hypothetical protein